MADDPQQTPRPARVRAEAFGGLVHRAEAGDEAAAKEVRGTLAELPEIVEVLGGNLANEAEKRLVAAYAGKCLASREAVTQKLKNLRAELGAATASPLEQLLIGRIVATWLHLAFLEFKYAAGHPLELTLAAYYQRAISAANRRHLAAIKVLAEVRRLALPAIQVGPNLVAIDARGRAERENNVLS